MSSQRNAIKRQKKAVKVIDQSVQSKLDVNRKQLGEVEYKQREQIKSMIMSRPAGNY